MMQLFTELKEQNSCRFLHVLSGKRRQLVLGITLTGLVLLLGRLMLVPEAQRAGAAPGQDKPVAEQTLPVGSGRKVSRAAVTDPFTARPRAEQPALTAAGSLKKQTATARNIRLCGIISNADGPQALLAGGKGNKTGRQDSGWLMSPGQSLGGITLVSIDEAGGTVIINDGQGERTLVLGR